MHDLQRERIQAWAKLLEGPEVAGIVDDADDEPRALGTALAECKRARTTIGAALGALATRPPNGISREWVACIDEILSIADRACVMLVAAQDPEPPAHGVLWPVWQGGPAN